MHKLCTALMEKTVGEIGILNSDLFPTSFFYSAGGRGRGGALILGRSRAFDLFASVDAHL